MMILSLLQTVTCYIIISFIIYLITGIKPWALFEDKLTIIWLQIQQRYLSWRVSYTQRTIKRELEEMKLTNRDLRLQLINTQSYINNIQSILIEDTLPLVIPIQVRRSILNRQKKFPQIKLYSYIDDDHLFQLEWKHEIDEIGCDIAAFL